MTGGDFGNLSGQFTTLPTPNADGGYLIVDMTGAVADPLHAGSFRPITALLPVAVLNPVTGTYRSGFLGNDNLLFDNGGPHFDAFGVSYEIDGFLTANIHYAGFYAEQDTRAAGTTLTSVTVERVTAVPEPPVAALLLIGGWLVARARRGQRA
jgi:hypothetical protein